MTAGEESWAGLANEGEEGTAEDGEDLSGVAAVMARGVLDPLGVALPMVFVFDAPVTANDLVEALRGGLRRVEAGHEVAHAVLGERRVFFGALGGAGNTHHRTSKGQAEALGLEGDYADLVASDAPVRPTLDGKRGEASSSRLLA